jgi:hypothetical protein
MNELDELDMQPRREAPWEREGEAGRESAQAEQAGTEAEPEAEAQREAPAGSEAEAEERYRAGRDEPVTAQSPFADRDPDREFEPQPAAGPDPYLDPDAAAEPQPAVQEAQPPAAAEQEFEPEHGPVLSAEDAQDFRERWSAIQAMFVDDPHRAAADADEFVGDVAQAYSLGLERRRQALTSAWAQDGHDGTEQLRLTLREYRGIVDRILTG